MSDDDLVALLAFFLAFSLMDGGFLVRFGLVGPGCGFRAAPRARPRSSSSKGRFCTRCRERECARWSVFLCRSEQVNASRERETF